MEAKLKMATSSRTDRAPDRFIKGFIANLVLAGHQSIPPREPKVTQGFWRVVEMLDERARKMLSQKASFSSVRPWIDAGNQLRLSPTGGVENWERALRAAQLTFTKVGNPDYELVSFEIDRARAQSELDHLDAEFRTFVADATTAFLEKAKLGE
jgi:hypothetical protein